MTANISVLGLYDWDGTIFANLAMPTGMDATDKATLIDNLLMETAELEVIYTSPAFMKAAIGRWSVKELPTWNRVYAAAQAEYNPIENYNRYEESTVTTDGQRQHSGADTRRTITDDSTSDTRSESSSQTISQTVTNSGTDTTSGSKSGTIGVTESTTNSGTDTTTNKIAAFDTNTLVDHDSQAILHGHAIDGSKTETSSSQESGSTVHGHVVTTSETDSGTLSGTETVNYDGDTSETFTHGEKIEDDNEVTTDSHIHGNIGVTTSQQMLESELMIAPKLNVFNYIIESFKQRFCILVY